MRFGLEPVSWALGSLLSLPLLVAVATAQEPVPKASSPLLPAMQALPLAQKDWRPALRREEFERRAQLAERELRLHSFAISPVIDWKMAPRFGSVDANGNSIPDIPNTAEYVLNLLPGYCAANDCGSINPRFQVTFDAARSWARPLGGAPAVPGGLRRVYSWRVNSSDGSVVAANVTTDPQWTTSLPEGNYDVSLTLILAQSVQQLASGLVPVGVEAQGTSSARIRLDDIVIVSVGDSFSAGEGNPERFRLQAGNDNAVWADDGRSGANSIHAQRHRRAHRSTLGWPGQVALAIEQADPRSSVTFISVATTGAKLRDGITTGTGAENEPQPPGGLPSQLDEVASILGNRHIDLLLVSAGINDAGFRDVLTGLLIAGQSSGFMRDLGASSAFADASRQAQREAVVQAALTGNWSAVLRQSAEPCMDCTGVNGIRASYATLAARLQSLFPGRLGEVVVLGYPDPTGVIRDGQLYWCNKILDDVVSQQGGMLSSLADLLSEDIEIDTNEQIAVVERILGPLNNQVFLGATDAGWQFIPTDAEFANGHGYCAAWPIFRPGAAYYFGLGNPYPQPVPASDTTTQWVRTAQQSRVLQGPLGRIECGLGIFCLRAAVDTAGTMHPNELGHQAVKAKVLANVALPVEIPDIGAQDVDDQISEAISYSDTGELHGVVTPRTDVDIVRIDASTLAAPPSPLASHQPMPPGVGMMPTHPGITITLNLIGDWVPLLRLYDSAGKVLAENARVLNGRVRVTHWHAAGESPVVFAAISAQENDNYDPVTGAGGKGGKGGAYFIHAVRGSRTQLPIGIAPLAPEPMSNQ